MKLSSRQREDGLTVDAINNVVPSYSLFYVGSCSGWNFALASLHDVHRPEWNCIDELAQKDTNLKVDFISERGSRERATYHPSKSPFSIVNDVDDRDALTISSFQSTWISWIS